MKIDFAGRTWAYDPEDITLKQAMAITQHAGMTLGEWEKALEDPEGPRWLPAILCLYWLMLAQDGQVTAIADVDFPVLRFANAVVAAVNAEAAARAEEAPDPTGNGGLPAAAEPKPDLAESPAG